MRYDFLLLYPIHPHSWASYRKSFARRGAKNDPPDDELLLELIRLHRDRFHAWVPDDAATRTLQLLVEYRRRGVDGRTRLIERITSLLKNYYAQALEWAGELDHSAACDFLEQWPSLPALQQATAEQRQPHYRKRGRAKPGGWRLGWGRSARPGRSPTIQPSFCLRN
jgi:transposase